MKETEGFEISRRKRIEEKTQKGKFAKKSMRFARKLSGRSARKIWLLLAILVVCAGAAIAIYVVIQNSVTVKIDVDVAEKQRFQQLQLTDATIEPAKVDSYSVPAENPKYLTVDSIGIEKARILALGVLARNADCLAKYSTEEEKNKNCTQQLDAPKNINDAGWYNCQINPERNRACSDATKPVADGSNCGSVLKRPGDGDTICATLIDGHTCFGTTASCVFDHLSSAKAGDQIKITLGDDREISYKVVSVEVVPLQKVNMLEAIKSPVADHEGLTLITCAGTYAGARDVNGTLTASERVIVRAATE